LGSKLCYLDNSNIHAKGHIFLHPRSFFMCTHMGRWSKDWTPSTAFVPCHPYLCILFEWYNLKNSIFMWM